MTSGEILSTTFWSLCETIACIHDRLLVSYSLIHWKLKGNVLFHISKLMAIICDSLIFWKFSYGYMFNLYADIVSCGCWHFENRIMELFWICYVLAFLSFDNKRNMLFWTLFNFLIIKNTGKNHMFWTWISFWHFSVIQYYKYH